MNSKQPTVNPESNDPIVEELHAVKANLLQKYEGNMHAYSVAARANAVALGFQFMPTKRTEISTTKK
jgi:hypothetical protein